MKLTPNEAMALAAMVRRAGMGAVLEELAQFARELAAAGTLSIASSGLIVATRSDPERAAASPSRLANDRRYDGTHEFAV